MAVLVEFDVLDATEEQMMAVETRTQERGEAIGRPPYAGCMFLAATPRGTGFHFVSAWRTESAFRDVLEAMIEPDMAAEGAALTDVRVSPVISMAIPGQAAP